MKQAYIDLINHALAQGFKVSVWDGEAWPVKQSIKFREIIDAIKSVEVAELQFRDAEGNKCGWAEVGAYGLDPEETVIDYTVNPWLENWNERYNQTIGA